MPVTLGNMQIDIFDTAHGPEIGIYGGGSSARLTVFEFEQFVHQAGILARTARAKMSARARTAHLPMRAP